MDKWVVPLVVAAVAAIATIGAAYLAAAKDRRDARTAILRDLEIASKLPDGSMTRRVLEIDINERTLLLTTERAQASATWRSIAVSTGCYSITAGFFLGRKVESGGPWQIALGIAVTVIVWISITLLAKTFGNARRTAIVERLADLKQRAVDHQQRPSNSEDETPPPA